MEMAFTDRVTEALERRAAWLPADTTAYRVINEAGDGVPGVVLDRFGSAWLLQSSRSFPPLALETLPEARSLYQKRLGAPDRETPRYLDGARLLEPFLVRENGRTFEIDFQAGYSTGLFLDHRENRRRMEEWAGERMLNCFAYTGSFSVYAGLAGAQTVSIDLSNRSLDWARRNFQHNALVPEEHDFLFGDVFSWLPRLGRKGRRFSLIVLDPPTFARNRRGKVFRVEKDLGELVTLAIPLLERGGRLLVSSNCRRLPQAKLAAMVREAFAGPVRLEKVTAGLDFPGETLLRGVWVEA